MIDNLVYLDNAATSFPKPQSVLDQAQDCAVNWCGNSGRGSHMLAIRSAEAIFATREAIASMFKAAPENVIFTLNTTQSLNLAIKGIMARGGHMLISDLEHNSVFRPVSRLQKERKITYDIFPTHKKGLPLSDDEILSGIIHRLRPNTKMICAVHTSNICSYSLPINRIGALCRRHGLVYAVDAAQAAGHCEISLEDDNIDILCLPGHKGMYAPQGVGVLILRGGLRLETVIEGGNGVNSLETSMGDISPERYEGGTLCTPAIYGLGFGIDFINNIGIPMISAHEKSLWKRAYSSLSQIRDIVIYAPEYAGSTLLFNICGVDPETLGSFLSEKGICVRTGYHCSPLAHKALMTPDGGAVRASFSAFNTDADVDALSAALEDFSHS